MPRYKADVTLHIHGSLTVEAKDETEATNKIVDGHYALSDFRDPDGPFNYGQLYLVTDEGEKPVGDESDE